MCTSSLGPHALLLYRYTRERYDLTFLAFLTRQHSKSVESILSDVFTRTYYSFAPNTITMWLTTRHCDSLERGTKLAPSTSTPTPSRYSGQYRIPYSLAPPVSRHTSASFAPTQSSFDNFCYFRSRSMAKTWCDKNFVEPSNGIIA